MPDGYIIDGRANGLNKSGLTSQQKRVAAPEVNARPRDEGCGGFPIELIATLAVTLKRGSRAATRTVGSGTVATAAPVENIVFWSVAYVVVPFQRVVPLDAPAPARQLDVERCYNPPRREMRHGVRPADAFRV